MTGGDSEARPVASFVCITYNHVGMIRRCLDAFLAQDIDFAVEIIVHDDASTDGTREVLAQYESEVPGRLTLMLPEVNSRLRRANALCDAVERARGDYILLCEGDDYWSDPLKARRQVDFLAAHPGYSFAFHDAVRVERSGAPLQSMVPDQWRHDWTPAQIRGAGFLFFPIGTLCFRRPTARWPAEFLSTPNGDVFLARLLAESGSGHWMEDLGPLHSTVHAGGVWSGATQEERARMLARTYLNLTSWLIRAGHQDDARTFAEGTLLPHLAESLGIPGTDAPRGWLDRLLRR